MSRDGVLRCVGILSGTSADGIDVAIVDITGEHLVNLLHYEVVKWEATTRELIFNLMRNDGSVRDVANANFLLGTELANAVLGVLQSNNDRFPLSSIDLIGSHGQTVWHEPSLVSAGVSPWKFSDAGRVSSTRSAAGTLQIGEPAVIAAKTGITTIGDFRVADISHGGAGAPLISTLDCKLLRPPSGAAPVTRALLNVGGMSNVSLIPSVVTDSVAPMSFDTGPGNCWLDTLARRHNSNLDFDVDGLIAASGAIIPALLAAILSHPYFARRPPKTTGRETWTEALLDELIQEHAAGCAIQDALATTTEAVAQAIAEQIGHFAASPVEAIFVSGGGSRNRYLMNRIAHHAERVCKVPVRVESHDILIDADAKEAVLFAYLAALAVLGTPNNIPVCTGASSEAVCGKIVPGKNYISLMRRVFSTNA